MISWVCETCDDIIAVILFGNRYTYFIVIVSESIIISSLYKFHPMIQDPSGVRWQQIIYGLLEKWVQEDIGFIGELLVKNWAILPLFIPMISLFEDLLFYLPWDRKPHVGMLLNELKESLASIDIIYYFGFL